MRRYEEVRNRLADAASRGGVDPDRVVLVAVTKYASIAQVRELIEAGNVDYGEGVYGYVPAESVQPPMSSGPGALLFVKSDGWLTRLPELTPHEL